MTTDNSMIGKVSFIEPPIKTLRFEPIKDSMVIESQPYLDYGQYNALQVAPDTTGKAAALFGFSGINLSTDQLAHIKSAKLILHTSDPSITNVSAKLHTITDNNWTENGVTWKSAPTYTQYPIMEATATAGVISYDITKYLTNLGCLSDGSQFGFRVDSDSTTASNNPLSVNSRESTDHNSRPIIEVQYYKYEALPVMVSVAGDITVEVGYKLDIPCDVTVDSNNSIEDIACDLTVEKDPITPVEIVCDVTAKQRYIGFINGDLTVEKDPIDPVVIPCDLSVAVPIGALDITGDLTIEKQSYNGDIICDVSFAVPLDPSVIDGDLTVEKDAITPAEIVCDISVPGDVKADITGDLTVEKQSYNGDIICDISLEVPFAPIDITGDLTVKKQSYVSEYIICDLQIQEMVYQDITADLTVEKQQSTTDINCDISVRPCIGKEINCFINVVNLMAPTDINCDIEIVPGGIEEINCDVTVEVDTSLDIPCDITVEVRANAFIDGTVSVALPTAVEITSDVTVEGYTSSDIVCDITVPIQPKSYSYCYIM